MTTSEIMRRELWWNPFLKVAQIGLRFLAFGFATASIITMLTSNQEIYMMEYIVVAKAHYSYSSALRYKLIADVVVAFSSLLSLIFVHKKTKRSDSQPKMSFYLYLLLVDGVMMALAISGCSAATTVGFIALQGVEQPGISWAPICNLARKFCGMITFSIVSSYVAFSCIIVLCFISAFKIKLLETH